jgi:hypothetical protein
MSDASPDDFAAVEQRLTDLSGRGSRDVITRSHAKLAMWSIDQGWPDQARHHFEAARKHASKELAARLDTCAHWFGLERRVSLGVSYGDGVQLPWIADWMDDAARDSIEEQFKESFKSPWKRTWTFGRSAPEGRAIQSAELQASWAGAMWLMRPIQRQHAALIYAKSREPEDVARVVTHWVRGGGKEANALVNAVEGFLTTDAVGEILVTQLHEGRSATDRQSWIDVCHSLWAEMPDSLVGTIVQGYAGPPADIDPYGIQAQELSLFGKLMTRSPAAVAKAYDFSSSQLAVLMRSISPGVIGELDETFLSRGLRAALEDQNGVGNDWTQLGWASLAKALSLLGQGERQELRPLFLSQIPDSAVSEIVVQAAHLIQQSRLSKVLRDATKRLRDDIEEAGKGRFTLWNIEPSTVIARILVAQNRSDRDAVGALVRAAKTSAVDPMRRQSALSALVGLARRRLVDRDVVAPVLQDEFVPVNSFLADVSDTDQKYEDIQRLSLSAAFEYSDDYDGRLLSASRDSSARVRHAALELARWLSLESVSSSSIDAALLGALYDPDPGVRALAVPTLWRGKFANDVLRDVARDRVLELWSTSPVGVRLAVARVVALRRAEDDDTRISRLAGLCATDRSLLVRDAARRKM